MKRFLLFILLSSFFNAHAVIVVAGDSTQSPFAFTADVKSQVYDRATGTFFVGLEDAATNLDFTIARASRPTFTTSPKFIGITTATNDPDSVLRGKIIELLALSSQSSGLSVLLTAVLAQGATQFTATNINALYTDGSGLNTTSSSLNDANEATTSGIFALAANSNTAFAIVKPPGTNSVLGSSGSGVAMVKIGTTTPITLDIQDATMGISGNKAFPLNNSSMVLKGTGGGSDVAITTTCKDETCPVANVCDEPLYWDEPLQRLFIGFEVISGSMVDDIVKSIVVGRLSNGALELEQIVNDSALDSSMNQIGIAKGSEQWLRTKRMRVMHTSTGPDYLIVDFITAMTEHGVFAVPLVNDTSSPTSSANGTFADKNSSLDGKTRKFTDQATASDGVPINDPVTDPAAVVGAGRLPISPLRELSDMVVVGDAVYVSIKAPFESPDNDSGIFYSQAIFDNQGKIIRWTPWARRIVPLNAFPGITLPGGSMHNGAIKFFEVDAKTGNVWVVEGTTDKTVGITSWTKGVVSNDLLTSLNIAMPNGSYSVLDLDQSTRGFLNSTVHRYALFGGLNKVVFARTSEAIANNDAFSPQQAITNYSLEKNLRTTSLPTDAGCCQVLEYSRAIADEGDINYFFAGTENGLFVFSGSGSGFDASSLEELNATPFDGAWSKVDTISGSVIDIKTSGSGGKALYVLVSESTVAEPFKSTLYSIPFASTTSAMFVASNIRTIAQTGTGVFAGVLQFTGIQIIATHDPTSNDPEASEQLVLTSNQGLFRSNASQAMLAGVAEATNQTDADWRTIFLTAAKTSATTAFNGIAGMDTPVRNTVWPIAIQDQAGFKTFDRASINQYSCVSLIDETIPLLEPVLRPAEFNARPQSAALKTLDPITYFFSDGGRRFFIFNRIIDPSDEVKIGVLPYNVTDWSVGQQGILTHPALDSIDRFFWIKQIGATGILMSGTQSGVIGLQ